jgi:deoxyadenosine/deoxycytidine kinase
VEGNIAVGKTTFLELLSQAHPEYHIVHEPLVRWQNVSEGEEESGLSCSQENGGNLLKLFYDDQKRWGYTFQTYACISRLRKQMEQIPEENRTPPLTIQLFERSAYSDKYCFARNLMESGVLNPLEWSVYSDWHSFLLEALPVQLDGFIYLKKSPEECMKRLHQRNRMEEKDVSIDYLKALHTCHEEWLVTKSYKSHPSIADAPVLILESNPDLLDPENDDKKDKIFKKVHDFITKM